MITIYRTKRAILDTVDGQDNTFFKSIITGLQMYLNQIEKNNKTKDGKIIPYNYQSFVIDEDVFLDYCENTGINYWDTIAAIINACDLLEQSDPTTLSDLWDVFVAIKADKSILNEEVPKGLNNRTYIDEEDNTVVNTWETWYSQNSSLYNGVINFTEDNIEKVLLLTRNGNEKINRKELKILYNFVNNDNTYNSELLSKRKYLEIKNSLNDEVSI